MTTRADWLALAERLEKATGANFALEQDIALAGSFGDSVLKPPPFTVSLDAAVSLIERELPEHLWLVANANTDGTRGPTAIVALPEARDGSIARAATPALALCAAFAKATAEGAEG